MTQRGVPAFAAAESCTVALAGMLQTARWKAPPAASMASATVSVDDFPAGALDEAQAKQLFARFGLPCARESVVTTSAEAEAAAVALGGRMVLKILSSAITHKSDVGGVAVNLTADNIGARLTAMTAEVQAKASMEPKRFLVQEMVSGGTDCCPPKVA
jgi:acyl-CoA synthetase (NDP forming)